MASKRVGEMPCARNLRITHCRDINATERKMNCGVAPNLRLTYDDILPPQRSIPWNISAPEDRDWAWLLQVWLEKDPNDPFVDECRARLASQK